MLYIYIVNAVVRACPIMIAFHVSCLHDRSFFFFSFSFQISLFLVTTHAQDAAFLIMFFFFKFEKENYDKIVTITLLIMRL